MTEILFTESAAGSMQYAKSIKNTIGSSTAVIFMTDDGSEPTPEEIAKAEAKVEWERRKRIKNAVPMEGSPQDVAWFPLNLSVGDISDPFSDARAGFLQSQVLCSDPHMSDVGKTMIESARQSLEKVLSSDSPLRIWTSNNPDELCGFCHLLTLLPENADIRVIKLPEYDVSGSTLTTHTGWGEVLPERLGAYLPLEKPLTAIERRHYTTIWHSLRRENGPLRAVVNGRLTTVGADFYDCFILRELEKQPDEFHEARLIGEILGKYQLGISDSLIALRIEDFISRGILTPVTESEDGLLYRRYLRKQYCAK